MIKRTLDYKLFILIMLLFLLSSCVKPPGQLTENDYLWEEKIFNVDYKTVYRNIVTGFRMCAGTDGGSIRMDQIGAPDCIIYDDKKEILCDIYFNEISGRTNLALGIIKIKEINDVKTSVRYGQYTRYSLTRPVKHWMNFSEGTYSCEVKE